LFFDLNSSTLVNTNIVRPGDGEKTLRSSRPVAKFQDLVEYNTFLGGQDFCYYYMFKTNFSGRNKTWGAQKKFWEALTPNAPQWLRTCGHPVCRHPITCCQTPWTNMLTSLALTSRSESKEQNIARNTSLLCRLRLGHHSVVNLNKRTYRLCLCGGKETEEHLPLNCSLHSALWFDLMQSVKSILLKEGLRNLLSSVLHVH